MLPRSLLQFLLPVSLWASSAYARSSFNFTNFGTGVRYSNSGKLCAKDIGVSTTDDTTYLVDIKLGGEKYTLLLDTGSTDLWLAPKNKTIKFTNTTELTAEIRYGQGSVGGKINFAEVEIGDFKIKNQAFIVATEVKDIELDQFDGVLGMAFDVATIYTSMQRAWGTEAADKLGRAPITSLFAQDPSLPNNFDLQLGRTSALEDVAEGTFIISDHADGFERVKKAPKLPRVVKHYWSVVMDAMLVDGKSFEFNKSSVSGVPSGKVVSVLDTGFSLPALPTAAVDAIYSSIPGAEYDPFSETWLVPCDASADLAFVFGGHKFIVHPLDLTMPIIGIFPINGTYTNVTACVNQYQPLTLDPSRFPGLDMILGDSFLRNVYASFDYGDYYPGNRTNGLPYVQMVSTTHRARAWKEFEEERVADLAKLPPALPPAAIIEIERQSQNQNQKQTQSVQGAVLAAAAASDSSSGDSWSKKYGNAVLGLLAANLLLGFVLLAVTITMCVRGVKGKSVGQRYAPVRFKEPVADDYENGAPKYGD